jgi:transcription initiation factor TFIID subunit TAF12
MLVREEAKSTIRCRHRRSTRLFLWRSSQQQLQQQGQQQQQTQQRRYHQCIKGCGQEIYFDAGNKTQSKICFNKKEIPVLIVVCSNTSRSVGRYGSCGREFYSIIDGAFASMLILLSQL